MRQCVEWPLKHNEKFFHYGINAPSGVLLFGPPGCSKTLIAKAVATESGLNFLAVKGPELFSKYVGESERSIRELFRRARQASPAIIFIDEIDALSAERSTGKTSNAVSDRVLTTLLNEMDGIESVSKVIVIAATNRPDVIDKAMLRPGRLDRIVYVPLPNSKAREEIFKLCLKKIPSHMNDEWISKLVHRTKGYSGAEVVAVCQESAMEAIEDELENGIIEGSERKVKPTHFDTVLKHFKARISAEEIKYYSEWAEKLAFVPM